MSQQQQWGTPQQMRQGQDAQYAQQVEDEELQQLMRTVMTSRKMEKDYKNIEDQIRCLKMRMFQLNQAEIQMRNHGQSVSSQSAGQTEDFIIEQEGKERQRVALEHQYAQMKHEYIRLNNLEGELHSQISDLRGNTSDQMMQNKNLEGRLGQENQVAQRLRGQILDIDGQIKNEQQAIDIMEQKRRATELETQDTTQKLESCEREIYAGQQRINQLNLDNSARREVLDQTAESMSELGMMLQDMRHATDKLRQIFWEQEKKIEYLRRDLDACDETRRQKEKQRRDLQTESSELEKTLQIRKMELAVEKENEVAILKHQEDLKDRLQQLNAEIVLLEQKQKILNQKLVEFIEVNERIRQEIYHRDRQAEIKTTMNKAIVANSEAERREASRSRSKSPTRRSAAYDNSGRGGQGPTRKYSPLRRPSKSPTSRYQATASGADFQNTYVKSSGSPIGY